MTAWLIGSLVWSSLLMLLVLAIRRPFAALFGAGPAYALWLLPALRLFLPPLPDLGQASLLPSTVMISLAEGTAANSSGGGASWWVPVLIAVWAVGALAFTVGQWVAYRRLLASVSLASRSLGRHANLPLVESSAVHGPLAVGLLDRRIIVPADFASRYSEEERALALEHEAVHHQRGDIWWNLAALAVLALNWFNPIAWIAFRAYREDQELACDAVVAAFSAPDRRRTYATAIVKSASRPGQVAACPLNQVDQLKRRLKMMNRHHPSRARMLGGAATIALLAGLSATLGSPSIAHPHPEGEHKEQRVIIMSHKAGDGEAGVRQFHLRRGEGNEVALPDCDNGEATRIEEGGDNERTRIVLCARGGGTAAERAEGLQRARDRLAQDSHLSEAQRERVTAALDREIARLRGQ